MRIGSLCAVAAIAAAVGMAQPAIARHGDVGAALAAGIVGAAIGASLSQSVNHDKVIYHGGHGGHHGKRRFSPEPGIECYDASRSCYHDDGGYAAKWSRRAYGN